MDTTAPEVPGPIPTEGKKGNGSLHKAASGAHATVDRVAAVADRALQQAKPALERAAQAVHGTIDRAAGVAQPTAAWLVDRGTRIQTTQRQLYDDTCKYVAANPIRAVVMSLAAGFLLGKLLR